VLPPRTRNNRGNKVKHIKISSNFVNNCLTVVSFNETFSRMIIHVFLEIYDFGTGNFNISQIGFTKLFPSIHPL
jgi:hypothetical protein